MEGLLVFLVVVFVAAVVVVVVVFVVSGRTMGISGLLDISLRIVGF